MRERTNRGMKLSAAAAAAVAGLGLAVNAASAQTITNFQVASGPWVDPLSWDNGEPTNTSVAQVNNAGTANIATGAAAVADILHVGLLPGNSGNVSITDGSLTLGEARVGGREMIPDGLGGETPNGGGTGTIVQTGGAVSITATAGVGVQSLFLGDGGLASGNTAQGTYNISGGSLVSGIVDNDSIVVGTGPGSTGTFIQSGSSTVSTPGFLVVGRRGASGTYSMNGGTLNVAQGAPLSLTPTRNMWIGDGDAGFNTATSGQFNQLAGTVTVGDAALDTSQHLEIGRRSGTGFYDISGGSLTVANGGIVVGGGGDVAADPNSQKGNGTLRLSGTASITVNDSTTDGTPANNGSRGNMSIGSASNAAATTVGVVDMDGGTFTFNDPNGIVAVGNGGSGNAGGHGTLDVSGGTFSIAGIPTSGSPALLDVGRNGSAGLVKLSGTGTINVNQFTINSSSPTGGGTVTRELRVEGGTMNVRFWEMGSVVPPLNVTRVVNQTGGDINVTGGTGVAHRAGRVVTYNLSGGTFDHDGNFPLDTSTLNVSGTHAFTVTTGAYRNGSGTTNLSGGGTLSFGNVNDTGNQGGTWNVSGGTLNVTGNFNITNANPAAGPATLNLTGGTGTINNLATGGTVAGSTLYISGGTHTINNLTLSDNGILKSDNVVAKNSNVTLGNNTSVNTNSGTLTLSGPVGGAGALNKTGAGTLALTGTTSFTGGTNVNAGVLQVKRMHEGNAVNIAAGAKLQVLDSSPTLPNHPSGDNAFVSRPTSLTIAPTGQLDLGNNDLIVDYTTTSPLEQIEDMISTGFNGGEWNGPGIISTTALNDPNFVLAVAENALLLQPFGDGVGDDPLFSGQVVDDTTVLVKFTHRVDLDLDGLITGNDAAVFNAFFNEGQPATWQFGDLDYDGVYSGNDAAIFNGFYNESLASVPEPAGLALAACGLALLARRRRRS